MNTVRGDPPDPKGKEWRPILPQRPRRRPFFETTGGRALAAASRSLYTHNPFYVISAALVLYGLSRAFGASERTAEAWTLLGVLWVYTAAMALAGLLIIRLGRVWEDARSIVLVVVVLFGAVSVSFDEILLSDPGSAGGAGLLFVGLGLAIGLSEALLGGAGIRLRALFRAPYYAILSLFYLYPLLLSELFDPADTTAVTWGILAFGAAAGAVFLTLIPAIRRGREYAAENGTPWRWPYFPWVLFGMLGAGALLRSYWLTISFYPAYQMYSPFAPYFLVPFALAGAALLVEFGLVHDRRWMRAAALALPALAVAFSFPPESADHACRAFLMTVTGGLGSPVRAAALAAVVFYAYAALRGLRGARVAAAAAALAASVTGPGTAGLADLQLPGATPLALAALYLALVNLRARSSWLCALSVAAAVASVSLAMRGSGVLPWWPAVTVHLAAAGLLAVGAAFGDRLGRLCQDAGAPVMLWLFAGALFFAGRVAPGVPGWAVGLYCAGVLGATLLYWRAVGNRAYLLAAGAEAAFGAAYLGALLYALVTSSKRGGLAALFWGTVCFALAVGVSSVKGGALAGLRSVAARLKELARKEA